jgi:hypothetical protein
MSELKSQKVPAFLFTQSVPSSVTGDAQHLLEEQKLGLLGGHIVFPLVDKRLPCILEQLGMPGSETDNVQNAFTSVTEGIHDLLELNASLFIVPLQQ